MFVVVFVCFVSAILFNGGLYPSETVLEQWSLIMEWLNIQVLIFLNVFVSLE